MQKIGDSEYRLVGLDTCIFSEVLRNRNGALDGFRSLIADGHHVPCFSVYSLFELRRRREIYDQFVEFFDVFPCAVLKNEDQLFVDEVRAYPHAADINPVLFGFSGLDRDKGTNLRSLLDDVFSEPNTLRREAEWPQLQREILDAWIALKANFSPKGTRYKPADGVEFTDRVAVDQANVRNPEWVRRQLANDGNIRGAAFPSLRMTTWTVFFRLYIAEHRTPTVQDVFDAVISTPAPYLDAVVTENYQADIYQQVARIDPALASLDVYRLRGLTARSRHT